MNRIICFKIVALFNFICFLSNFSALAKTEIEVAHWWTSEGEAKAVTVIRDEFNNSDYVWIDSAIQGGGGDKLIKTLRARIASGIPPAAVQMYMGPSVKMWAKEGVLVDLSSVASANNWDGLLPDIIKEMIRYKGNYYAVPVNAHRVNWLWANSKVFREAKAKIPRTFDEFWVALDKIKAAGYVPIALGGQPWQESTMFEVILLGIGGKEFYNKIFVEHNQNAINSELMRKVFEDFRRLRQYTDPNTLGRTWDKATEMVMSGEAGLQFMGDWAKGEFLAAGKKPGKDFNCFPSPGTQGFFLIDTDTFVMFKSDDKGIRKAQMHLAKTVMKRSVQKRFNQIKGSAPARLDVDKSNFDTCGHAAINDFSQAAKRNMIIPSFTYSQATSPAIQSALIELITVYFNSNMPVDSAIQHFSTLIKTAN